jgi:hypothetical protein
VDTATYQDKDFDHPASYRILVLGDLRPDWSERLEGMSISVIARRDDRPVTSLFGVVPDQNALAGVLITLVELHLSILSVQRLFGNGSSSG